LQRADFLAQNAPKSFVAGLLPDPLGELTALSQTPSLNLTDLLLRKRKRVAGKRGKKGEESGGRYYAPPMGNY